MSAFETTTLRVALHKVVGSKRSTKALNLLQSILQNVKQITIFDLDGEKVLCRELMTSIMNRASDVLGKLYLSLSWRNYNLAEMVTQQKLEDIYPCKPFVGQLIIAL